VLHSKAVSQAASESETTPEPEAEASGSEAPAFVDRRRAHRPSALPMDPWLFFAAIALAAVGLVMVYSAGSWLGQEMHGNWEFFLWRQAGFLSVGLAGMLIISRLDYRLLRRFGPHLMFIALGMLVLVLIFGQEINGARRWIRFAGVGIQPSELAKLALAVFLAATLARQGERVRMFKRGFLPVISFASIMMLMVLLEKDLGTTLLMGALTLIMLFVAGTRLSFVVAAVMLAAPLIWQQIVGVDYRRGRLEDFLSGDGYQVHQALIAIGSGGAWGLGLGNGRQKLGFLPENHTDFILATVGEELGFVGIAVVLGLFGLLVWRGLVVAKRAPDRFGTYLATGISALFGLQALVNMAVVLEVIPAKGITLPFLSYGGSSLLASLVGVGILLSISRRPDAWRLSDQRGRRRSKAKEPEPERRPRNRRRVSEPAPA